MIFNAASSDIDQLKRIMEVVGTPTPDLLKKISSEHVRFGARRSCMDVIYGTFVQTLLVRNPVELLTLIIPVLNCGHIHIRYTLTVSSSAAHVDVWCLNFYCPGPEIHPVPSLHAPAGSGEDIQRSQSTGWDLDGWTYSWYSNSRHFMLSSISKSVRVSKLFP